MITPNDYRGPGKARAARLFVLAVVAIVWIGGSVAWFLLYRDDF